MTRPLPVEPPPSRFAMPDPAEAEPGSDVIAVGADLEPGTLLAAYRAGMFPMPLDPRRRRSEIAWFSPDPRGILPLDGMLVSRSLRRSLRRYDVTFDQAFRDVMVACATQPRDGQWITTPVVEAYSRLFELGWAQSIEVLEGDELVGGVYGVRIGRFFAGESMFRRRTDASKVGLVRLVEALRDDGVELFDVQWRTDHLATLGVIEISRREYLERLEKVLSS
jgi:leucyl/phenylalanyl-tRNA--protein transferase